MEEKKEEKDQATSRGGNQAALSVNCVNSGN